MMTHSWLAKMRLSKYGGTPIGKSVGNIYIYIFEKGISQTSILSKEIVADL
jgi:hypothetical protein